MYQLIKETKKKDCVKTFNINDSHITQKINLITTYKKLILYHELTLNGKNYLRLSTMDMLITM